ncbi:MAG: PKD domain-containing protein [Ideonella sp.]
MFILVCRLRRHLLAQLTGVALVLALVSCGGGGDDPPMPPNTAPTASIGSLALVRVGTAVLLDATSSTDADGDPLSYSWLLVSRPAGSGSALSNASSARPNLVPDKAGTYALSLTVSDGRATSSVVRVDVISAQPGLPVQMLPVGDTALATRQNARIAANFEVRVTDAFGDPVVMVPVTFSSSLNGSARPPIILATFTDGTVFPTRGGMPAWINYFHVAGLQQIVATADGLPSVTFTVDVAATPHLYDGLYECSGESVPAQIQITDGSVSFPATSIIGGSLNESSGAFQATRGSGIFQRRFFAQIVVDPQANARLQGTAYNTTGGEASGPVADWSCIRY